MTTEGGYIFLKGSVGEQSIMLEKCLWPLCELSREHSDNCISDIAQYSAELVEHSKSMHQLLMETQSFLLEIKG